jgi:hypothetical protein
MVISISVSLDALRGAAVLCVNPRRQFDFESDAYVRIFDLHLLHERTTRLALSRFGQLVKQRD